MSVVDAYGIRRLIIAAISGFAVALSAVSARAGEFPQREFCVATPGGKRVVDPKRLVSYLLGQFPINERIIINVGQGDNLYEQRYKAIVDDKFCTDRVGTENACSSRDVSSHNGIRAALKQFVRAADGKKYVIYEASTGRMAQDRAQILNRELIAPAGARYEIACVGTPEPLEPMPVARTEGPEEVGFRLTGKLEDLQRVQSGKVKKLTAIEPASFSAGGSRKKDSTEIQGTGFAGYAFNPRSGDYDLILIPFVSADTVFARDKSDRRTNLGVGMLASLLLRTGAGTDTQVDAFTLTPNFVTDEQAKTRIGSLKASWIPGFIYDLPLPMHGFRSYGDVRIRLTPRVLLDVGKVFADGGNDELSDRGNFVRAGIESGLSVRGREQTMLSQFELEASGKYLYGPVGPVRHFQRLKLALNYIFPDQENFLVGLEFRAGRQEDTLEKDRTWMARFGARF